MNIIKRGILSITRRPAKSLILFVVVFILGTVISAAISVYQAVDATEKSVYGRSNTIATVDSDTGYLQNLVNRHEMTYEEFNTITMSDQCWPSAEQLGKISELDAVEYYDYSKNYVFVYGSSVDLLPYRGGSEDEVSTEVMYVVGTEAFEPIYLKTNMLKLVDGRLLEERDFSEAANPIIISKKLADANGLSIGSTIHFFNNMYEFTGDGYNHDNLLTTVNMDCEIVGLFEIVEEDLDRVYTGWQYTNDQIYNTAITTNAALNRYSAEQETAGKAAYSEYWDEWQSERAADQYENYFVLRSPKDIEAFKAEAEQYLPQYTKITTTSDFYSALTAPLATMKDITSTALWITVAAAILLLGLIITLFLRSRRQELGIYMALGEKRSRVIRQIVIEVLIVAVLGMTLSLLVGNSISEEISDKIVTEQLIAEQNVIDEKEWNSTNENSRSWLTRLGYNKLIDSDYIIENYSVSLTPQIALLFFAVGLAVAVISTALPVIYVLRLNPKKILMEVT